MHEALTHRVQAPRAYREEMAFRFQDFKRSLRRFWDVPPHNRPRSQGAINIEKEVSGTSAGVSFDKQHPNQAHRLK